MLLRTPWPHQSCWWIVQKGFSRVSRWRCTLESQQSDPGLDSSATWRAQNSAEGRSLGEMGWTCLSHPFCRCPLCLLLPLNQPHFPSLLLPPLSAENILTMVEVNVFSDGSGVVCSNVQDPIDDLGVSFLGLWRMSSNVRWGISRWLQWALPLVDC